MSTATTGLPVSPMQTALSIGQIASYYYDYRLAENPALVKTLEVSLRPLSLDADRGLVHRWMNYAHVAQFWQQAWSEEKITAYLERQVNSYHQVMIVCVNQEPVAYTELYPVSEDALSHMCDHGDDDWGWHLLIGPPAFLGAGLSSAVGHSILRYLLDHSSADEIFCEPDHANQRMIRFVSRLAHQDRGLIQLGKKSARLMVCRRTDVENLTIPTLTYMPSAADLAEDSGFIKELLL